MARVASPMPIGSSPRKRPRPCQSSPGRRPCSCCVEPGELLGQPRVTERLLLTAPRARRAARPTSSSSSAGPRRPAAASRSISSSVFCGFSGKNSPCLAMNSPNCSAVSWPRACASSRSLRSSSISRTRSTSSGVAFSIACFMPWKRWSSISRPSRSLDLLVGLARLGVAPVVVLQLAHGPRGRRAAARRAASRGTGRRRSPRPQGVPLGLERPLEQLADLLQRAVEPVARAAACCAARRAGASGRRDPAGRPARGASAPASPAAARCPP